MQCTAIVYVQTGMHTSLDAVLNTRKISGLVTTDKLFSCEKRLVVKVDRGVRFIYALSE